MSVRIYVIEAADITHLRNQKRADEFRAFALRRFNTSPNKPQSTWLNQLGPVLKPQYLPAPNRPDDPTHADVEALLSGQQIQPNRKRAQHQLLEAWLAHRALAVHELADLTSAQPLATDIAGLPVLQLHLSQRISGQTAHTIAVFLDTNASGPPQ